MVLSIEIAIIINYMWYTQSKCDILFIYLSNYLEGEMHKNQKMEYKTPQLTKHENLNEVTKFDPDMQPLVIDNSSPVV